MRMAAFLDSDSSDGEDFEGFVVSPEEKESYKVWTKKRRASVVFDNSSDSDDNLTGDEDDDNDDDDEEEEEDDDDDDYESAEEEDEGNEVDDVLGDISLQDSGDEKLSSHMDQCPVCLMSLKEQLLGTPNNCPHVFCFECIQEWAKNATTCPVGRQPFTEILVHATRKGPVLKRIPVEERKADDDEVGEDPTYCEVCGGYDREDRMLLCDGCDQGYHMDCLTPAVAYVPIDEWYCPACASRIQPHVDPEELLHEGHAEEGLGGVPRVRATRGRPRGSTARRVSALGRTGTTQRARTVASTRGRGRTQRGRGRGRGRGKSSTRGRGRGRPRSSTRGQKRSKTKGQKRRRRKTSRPSEKTTGSSRIKRGRKLSKTRNPIKRRRIAEEDEVSPFIYEPVRRGRTVHARLLESLNSSGPTVEPGRSASLGRMPFPSRVEASSSFSLFGNTYALHDFADEEEETGEVSKGQDKTTAWSSESANPDVLGSIFQGLDSLLSSSDKVARDGKIITSTGHTICRSSSSSNAKAGKDSLGSCEDEIKLSFDVNISEKSAEEGKCRLKETDKSSKEPDTAKHSSKDERRQNDHVCFRENIFEKVSLSRTADMRAGSCGMLSDTSRPQKTSSPLPLIERRYSSPSTPVSSKCALSSFRIPKRSSKSQDEPSSPLVKQDPSLNSCISKFKIPKRTNSISSDDSSKEECSNSSIRKSVGQTSPVSLTFRIGQNMSHFPSTSNSVTHSNCVTESKSAKSCLTYTNSFRPIMQKNFQRKNSFNSSTTGTEPSVSDSCNVIRSHATTVKTMSRSMTLSGAAISATCGPPVVVGSGSAVAGPSVTNSNSVTTCQAKNHSRTSTASTTARGVTNSDTGKACHSAKASDILRTRSKTSSSLTKVTPLIDHLKAVEGKEQRRSNIEIIKMLQEKQKSMRKQMSCDLKGSSNARPRHSGKVDTNVLPKKEIHVSDKSSTCSRGVTLPVAIVKPSPQVQSPALNALSVVPGSSMQNSPVKSIASGIIDAHSSNNWEFKRVCSASGSYSGHVATTRKRGGTASRANGDREQQRKLGIARLQRHEQIIDEVKLALKPFFKHGEIDKDDYKLIMRKSVEKIKESSSSVDRDRVSRLVKKYIKKIKGVNFSGSP